MVAIGQVAVAVRDAEPTKVEAALEGLGESRRLFAPVGFAAGVIVLFFDGLKSLVLNWRLALVELVPAVWIWFTFWDLKQHFLHGRTFAYIHGPTALAVAAGAVLVTAAAYWCNVVFAFAVSGPKPPKVLPAIREANHHLRLILGWGLLVGVAHAACTVYFSRWGKWWFSLFLTGVVVVMVVTFVSIPARIIGVQQKLPLKQKATSIAVGGAISAAVVSPGFLLNRLGLLMIGVRVLLIPGIIVFSIGVALQTAGTTTAKAVKLGSHLGKPGPASGAEDGNQTPVERTPPAGEETPPPGEETPAGSSSG